jgi:hypothetical protein
MDLPSCPSCGQSVLDDDAADCPFCGASMSGGSSPAATASPANATSPDSVAADSATDRPKENDPFAVDPSVTHRAIPAAPKPTQKRPWRVSCPMCETPGFVPRQAAGREVKCANPQCLVPIFTAPAGKSTSKSDESLTASDGDTQTGGKRTLIALMLLLAAGASGGGFWYFNNSPSETVSSGLTAESAQSGFGTPETPAVVAATPVDKTSKTATPDIPPVTNNSEISIASIRKLAPELMIAAAQEREENRSKPFCRQLTAEFFAGVGQVAQAQAELKQLTQVGPDLPHLHITTLVNLWQHKQGPPPASPGPQLSEALQRSAKLTPTDPFAVDAIQALGRALIASGQTALAETTIKRLWTPGLAQHLRLDQLQCRQAGTFTLSADKTRPVSLDDNSNPEPLIIAGLVATGHSEAALAWARRKTTLSERARLIVAWAVGTKKTAQGSAAETLSTALADEKPTIRAVVRARVAFVDAVAKSPAASESITLATQALESCVAPRVVSLGEIKQLYRTTIEDVSQWLLKAQAQADLVGALKLNGQPEEAQKLFHDALASARSLGPGRDDIARRLKSIRSQGNAGLIQQMKSSLELTSDDAALQAGQQYVKKCQQWLTLADQRARYLDRIHRWGIVHGLGTESWKDIREHGLTDDLSIRDPFTSSTLPSFLFFTFQATGNKDATVLMNQVLPAGLPIDTNEQLRLRTRTALANGDLQAVIEAVRGDSNARRDRDSRFARRRILFELVGIAAGSEHPQRALTLVASIRDPRLVIWQEEAYLLLAAQLAANGRHALAWKYATDGDRKPTERVAMITGLLEGLGSLPPQSAPGT